MSSTPYSLDGYQDEAAPTYEESLDASRFVYREEKKESSHRAPLFSLGKQLEEARARRIEDMLETYVNPLVFSLGQTGLYKNTFFLVPSNVTALQTTSMSTETKILGFPDGSPASLIWLIGEEHTLEFWRQPAAMKELESCLKAHLVGTGHNLEDEVPNEINNVSHDRNTPTLVPVKKPFSGKTNSRIGQDNNSGAESRCQIAGYHDNIVPPGKVRLQVYLKDICLRVQTEMGLYDTRKGPALCLSIEVGS